MGFYFGVSCSFLSRGYFLWNFLCRYQKLSGQEIWKNYNKIYVGENLRGQDIIPKMHFKIQWFLFFFSVIIKCNFSLYHFNYCSFYCYLIPVSLQSILSSSLISIYSWTDLVCTLFISSRFHKGLGSFLWLLLCNIKMK